MSLGVGRVEQGDSIVRLAGRLLGDPERWRELVALNRLIPPYVADTARAGVLGPLSNVIYPLGLSSPEPVDVSALEIASYKRDLALEAGDLSFSGSEPQMLAGIPNLYEALYRRLEHHPGAHPIHLGYGSLLMRHLGETADTPRISIAILDLKKAILKDPRVESCSVRAVWEQEVLKLEVQVIPIAPGKALTLSVAFPSG